MNPGSTSLSYFTQRYASDHLHGEGLLQAEVCHEDRTVPGSFGLVNNVPVGDASSSHTDWQDALHVAYYNASNARLCYAKWSQWGLDLCLSRTRHTVYRSR